MNFIDTAAYKEMRLETNQNLDLKPTIIHFNVWISLVLTIQEFIKMETIRHSSKNCKRCELEKKISLIYRDFDDQQINEITQFFLQSPSMCHTNARGI